MIYLRPGNWFEFFASRTYLPSEISRVVGLWKEVSGEKIAQTLADPAQYDNLFPGIKDALKTQQYLERETKPIPAASTSSVPVRNNVLLMFEILLLL